MADAYLSCFSEYLLIPINTLFILFSSLFANSLVLDYNKIAGNFLLILVSNEPIGLLFLKTLN